MTEVDPWRAEAALAGYLDDDPWADVAAEPVVPAQRTGEQAEEEALRERAAVRAEARRIRIQREARRLVDAEGVAELVLPEAVTLATVLATPPVPVLYRVDQLWPAGGKVLLNAQKKAGKTTLRMNLEKCLVDGDKFLGKFEVTPIPDGTTVVTVDFEMPAALSRTWYGDVAPDNAARLVPFFLRGQARLFDLRDTALVARWAARLASLNPAIIIWDCLSPVLGGLGIEENSNTEVGGLLSGFDALCEQVGGAEGLLIHHMGHVGEWGRGASRLGGWCDSSWKLVQQRPDDDPNQDERAPRFFAAYGRDVDVPECQLSYYPERRWLTAVGGSRKDAGVAAALADILVLLNQRPRLSGRQIESGLEGSGHPRDTVRAAIRAGVSNGDIVTQEGPRHAILHSVGGQCAECAGLRGAHSFECAARLVEARTHTPQVEDQQWSAHRALEQMELFQDRWEDEEPSSDQWWQR